MTIHAGRARAITMWDFSWLERRWPGAGYEDWDVALAELAERGYDTVRIDAYPHLIDVDPQRTWTLPPLWTQMSWGAQSTIRIQILPQLLDFLRACARHGIGVALSSWFRRDVDDVRMRLDTPQRLAEAWISTLDAIDDAGLLDAIVYVDLCNEFPMPVWSPFVYGTDEAESIGVDHPRIGRWMRESIEIVRAAYPGLDYTFSFSDELDKMVAGDVSAFDLVEPHLWMAGVTDYYDLIGYNYERFDPVGFDNVVARGLEVYRADQSRFDGAILDAIDTIADWSRRVGKPVATTECWSIIDYKDWPGLEWDWVKELNEKAVVHAASTGRWTAIATSNFCGPQFVEMWRDIEYHRRLTDVILSAPIDEDLR
ncbi:cellulase-like family protein [Microbacterium sp.]|uniref:cellulase-like family protein n=1 Tax=Microbacterium sp. TaxID=51671 RepID=UPI003569B4D4